MKNFETDCREKDKQVQKLLSDLFEKHGSEGPAFLFSILLNGMINILHLYSVDAACARSTAKEISDTLSEAVNKMEEFGLFDTKTTLQ